MTVAALLPVELNGYQIRVRLYLFCISGTKNQGNTRNESENGVKCISYHQGLGKSVGGVFRVLGCTQC